MAQDLALEISFEVLAADLLDHLSDEINADTVFPRGPRVEDERDA
jgi:hypothetical protein